MGGVRKEAEQEVQKEYKNRKSQKLTTSINPVQENKP